jgi:hypothetical protein
MVKRKRDDSIVSFHRDFQEPTDDDRVAALGAFPLQEKRPEALWQCIPCAAPEDLDDPALYHPTRTSIPRPTFELDWLAHVPEAGQRVSDYISFMTSRSGRIRPIANAAGTTICLLPIVSSAEERRWPEHAPKLESLAELTKSFFQRPVKILDPATVTSTSGCPIKKSKFTMEFYSEQQQRQVQWNPNIKGRCDSKTNRSQYEVTSILDQLSWLRRKLYKDENACFMGVTIEDLYDGPCRHGLRRG